MKIDKVSIKNFRGFNEEITVSFGDLTAFVGKNDIGKSSILEALDIFFNDGKGAIKLDKDDINNGCKQVGDNDVVISVAFTDLPSEVVLDETNTTTLQNEYLIHSDGCLHIKKTFKNGATTVSAIKVAIVANHPSNENCNSLLQKKQRDLSSIMTDLNLECEDRRVNSQMRAAIWNHYQEELQIEETEIDVSSKDGDIKSIWEKIQAFLPYYSLFQSDRKNSDNDDEIQDPLKSTVKQILNNPETKNKLEEIAQTVKNALQEVSDLTLSKLREMNPEIANSLHPNINTEGLKWPDVFKGVSISGDDDIPINKRGSGVRRLVLLNFFRAEAERRQHETNSSGIIYAIEEPETSQHYEHQSLLINALLTLSQQPNTQIIITTHSANIVKKLDFNVIRLIFSESGEKRIRVVEQRVLPSPSLNEVNYFAFGEITEEYHNELYGYLQAKAIDEDADNSQEKKFDPWLQSKGCTITKPWTRINSNGTNSTNNVTIQTYIRNSIHHPENTLNVKYSEQELKDSIIQMIAVVKNI